MFEQNDDVLTVKELQAMLGVGKATAYNLLKTNQIQCFHIGKLWRIPKKAVEDYVKCQSQMV